MSSEEEELWIFFCALLSTVGGENDLFSLPHRAQLLGQVSSSAYLSKDRNYQQDLFLSEPFFFLICTRRVLVFNAGLINIILSLAQTFQIFPRLRVGCSLHLDYKYEDPAGWRNAPKPQAKTHQINHFL